MPGPLPAPVAANFKLSSHIMILLVATVALIAESESLKLPRRSSFVEFSGPGLAHSGSGSHFQPDWRLVLPMYRHRLLPGTQSKAVLAVTGDHEWKPPCC